VREAKAFLARQGIAMRRPDAGRATAMNWLEEIRFDGDGWCP